MRSIHQGIHDKEGPLNPKPYRTAEHQLEAGLGFRVYGQPETRNLKGSLKGSLKGCLQGLGCPRIQRHSAEDSLVVKANLSLAGSSVLGDARIAFCRGTIRGFCKASIRAV